MKQVIALVSTLLLAFGANAKSLVLVLADGSEVYYLLSAEKWPVMTCGDDTFTVNADQYAFAGVARFYISDTDAPSAVADAKSAGTRLDGQTLYVKTAPGGRVAVYGADGRRVEVKRVAHGDVTALDTGLLPPGTYVVRTGTTSFKFCKR